MLSGKDGSVSAGLGEARGNTGRANQGFYCVDVGSEPLLKFFFRVFLLKLNQAWCVGRAVLAACLLQPAGIGCASSEQEKSESVSCQALLPCTRDFSSSLLEMQSLNCPREDKI